MKIVVVQILMKATLEVNFTNLLAQSANGMVVILWCHSVSPTKLRPTLPLHSARKYAQFLCCMPCVNLMAVFVPVEC